MGIHKTFYRNGPCHRGGANVTFGDIVKIFGFKTAQVGAWVNKQEQQLAANLFFDALCDLMEILQVSETVLSLRGTLSIAFGVGGSKFSSAHYNSATKTISLAKNAGAGSLAHEFFHAFDHFISQRFIKTGNKKDFASALWLEKIELIEHPLNRILDSCYQNIFLAHDNVEPSNLFKNSVNADKKLNVYYYAMPQEISARAFEAFIQDQIIKNEFLVKGTRLSAEARLGIYPEGIERERIGRCFKEYFCMLGKLIDEKKQR